MSIQEIVLKIKSPQTIKRIGEVLVIILIFIGIFTLGRISALTTMDQDYPIEVIYPPLVPTNIAPYSAVKTTSKHAIIKQLP